MCNLLNLVFGFWRGKKWRKKKNLESLWILEWKVCRNSFACVLVCMHVCVCCEERGRRTTKSSCFFLIWPPPHCFTYCSLIKLVVAFAVVSMVTKPYLGNYMSVQTSTCTCIRSFVCCSKKNFTMTKNLYCKIKSVHQIVLLLTRCDANTLRLT